jgi:hypothetical protein
MPKTWTKKKERRSVDRNRAKITQLLSFPGENDCEQYTIKIKMSLLSIRATFLEIFNDKNISNSEQWRTHRLI